MAVCRFALRVPFRSRGSSLECSRLVQGWSDRFGRCSTELWLEIGVLWTVSVIVGKRRD